MEPVFEQEGYASDTFMNTSNVVKRLIREYEEHHSLIVAFDFDDTVNPSKPEYNCFYVIELLQELSKIDTITLICFTCRCKEEHYVEVREYLDANRIRCDYINENAPNVPFETSRKIFYNVFLEERAGLKSAYEQLVQFLDWYYHDREESTWDI